MKSTRTGRRRRRRDRQPSNISVIPLVSFLRQYLIRLFQARLTEAERSNAAQQLVKYVNGPQFMNPLEDMIARAQELRRTLQVEVKQHVTIWNDGWESYQWIEWDASHIDAVAAADGEGAREANR